MGEHIPALCAVHVCLPLSDTVVHEGRSTGMCHMILGCALLAHKGQAHAV